MDASSEKESRRPPRPFVSGRPVARPEPVATSSPQRPFPFAVNRQAPGQGVMTEAMMTTSPTMRGDTPRWTVAVYEPGLEHTSDATGLDEQAPSLELSAEPLELPAPAVDEYADVGVAMAEAVSDASRHANSLAAAEVLDSVAHRLRSGQILLPAGTSPRLEAAVIAAVLAALLGEGR